MSPLAFRFLLGMAAGAVWAGLMLVGVPLVVGGMLAFGSLALADEVRTVGWSAHALLVAVVTAAGAGAASALIVYFLGSPFR